MDIARDKPGRRRRNRLLWIAGAAAVLVLVWLLAGGGGPAARSVDASAMLVGTVERGEMLRQVRGPGTLVPEEWRWIAARSEARVDRILVEPGERVTADAVIVELSNPAVEREFRDAEFALRAARADHDDLRLQLESEVLSQEASFAAVDADHRQALLEMEANQRLYENGLIPDIELKRSQIRAEQLGGRREIEERRLGQLRESVTARLGAQDARLRQATALFELRHDEFHALTARATLDGVVQEVAVEEGQQVAPGANLARVVRPERLKAELRIAEVQARDVAIGQTALIDTRNGVVEGRVERIDPAAEGGTVTVDVALPDELPRGARPQQGVDGTIELERLADVVHVGRPAFAQPDSTVGLYRLSADGSEARRVRVRLGRMSVSRCEVVDGLAVGDRVILSDTSQFDDHERVRLKGSAS